MNPTTTGWIVFIAALGTMLGLIGVDVVKLTAWSDASTPFFIGTTLIHLGAVIGAFVGGKIIPADRDPDLRTRRSDLARIP